MRRFTLSSVLTIAASMLLAGCAGTVAMTPAPDAKNVGCANVSVRLPDTVGNLPERATDAQATGAWGDPTAVLLWCGVAAPGPTTMPCVEVNGVDWIIDDSQAPKYRFTTFGRSPTVTVVLDNTKVSGTTAITDLSQAVSVTQQVDQCLSIEDVPSGSDSPSGGSSPSPSPTQ